MWRTLRVCLATVLMVGLASLVWAQGAGSPLTPGRPSNVAQIADVTVTNAATVISAADASRLFLDCTNNDAAVNVRWGGSGVTATSGERLKAGASITITGTYAVYMISEGANVTVSCTKETL